MTIKTGQGCPYEGKCDNCDLPDCAATYAQILGFYSKEEAETRQKYSIKLSREEKKRLRRKEREQR